VCENNNRWFPGGVARGGVELITLLKRDAVQ
jgi:hypothetical protein